MTTTRRQFLGTSAGTLAGLSFIGCELLGGHTACAQTKRRETMVAGKRVRVVDVHAHAAVPEAMALMGLKFGGPSFRPDLHMGTTVNERLAAMDAQGIDMQALSINPFWYKAEPDVAEKVIQIQNEKLAEACAAHPDRFVAFASVALQHPEMAARQLETGVKKYGLRGAAIGSSVNGLELSDPKLHPVWAKAQELGASLFIHPQGVPQLADALKGNGWLTNFRDDLALYRSIHLGGISQSVGRSTAELSANDKSVRHSAFTSVDGGSASCPGMREKPTGSQ